MGKEQLFRQAGEAMIEHEKLERAAWRRKVWLGIRDGLTFAACIAVFVAFVAAYSKGVKAEEVPLHVYDDGATVIRLMPGPCVHPMIIGFVGQGGPEYTERLRAIESTWPHKDGTRHEYAGCWLGLSKKEGGGKELFFLMFSDGHRFVIPKAEFLRGKGTGT